MQTLADISVADPAQAPDVYARFGVVLCKGLVPAADLERLRGRIQNIVNMQARLAGLTPGLDVMELGAARPEYLPGVYDAINSHPEVHRLAGADALCGVADALINDDASNELIVSGLQLRMDLPRNQSELLGWHRDCDYFQEFPRRGLVAWLPLQSITEETGGVAVIPRSTVEDGLESVELQKQWPGRRKPHRVFEIRDVEAALISMPPAIRVTCKAGDALFLSLWNLHRSEPSRSSEARWTLQYRYFSASEATMANLDRATLEHS